MAVTSGGTPYVESSDLVANYPSTSLSLANKVDTKLDNALTANTQSGTTYTFVLADARQLVTATNAGAKTFTIPPQSSVTWLANSTIRVVNYGAGALTIAGGAGVTVTNATKTLAQYESAALIRTGSDAWTLVPFSGGAGNADFSNTATGTYTSGGINYKFVTFTGAGTLTVTQAGFADILVVGGGAGGGGGSGGGAGTGGGGAGGHLYAANAYIAAGSFSVVVGAGGGGGQSGHYGSSGSTSLIGPYVASGGGSGAPVPAAAAYGGFAGGSGGGGGNGGIGGAGVATLGNSGGTGATSGSFGAGGGGGASAAGNNGSTTGGGNGGNGMSNSITNVAVTRAGGGGGGMLSGTFSTGGTGGGGGGRFNNAGEAGTVNTGGGGGGTGNMALAGGAGGSGIVIVRVRTN